MLRCFNPRRLFAIVSLLCTFVAIMMFRSTRFQVPGTFIPINVLPREFQDFDFDQADFMASLPEDSPILVNIIKNWFLISPPGPEIPYGFTNPMPSQNGQIGQPAVVDNLLQQKRDGFFIECGAYDGEIFSNTLFFEMQRNWTGLLIEANQNAFQNMKSKNRKAYLFEGCLSGSQNAGKINFLNAEMVGGIDSIQPSIALQSMRNGVMQRYVSTVECLPLYSILLALGNPTVDFFSLDVEGAEWDIIKTIPWSKVDIRLILLENEHLGELNPVLEQFMSEQGYEVKERLNNQDIIFVKNLNHK